MGKMFWGIILISVGVLMIIKHVFGWDLPIFKILLGIFFIYLGLKTIFGGFHLGVRSIKSQTSAIFAEHQFEYPNQENENDYQTVFGKAELDLRSIDVSQKSVKLNLGAVFGELKVFVKSSTPLKVQAEAVFGNVQLPESNKVAFGEFTFQNEAAKAAPYHLDLDASAVFGQLMIQYKD